MKELSKFPLFSGISEDYLKNIEKISLLKRYKRGDNIFLEGDKGEGFFLVISGMVKIYKLSPEGKEHVLNIVGPGEIFAEAVLFYKDEYPAYADSLSDSELLFLDKESFLRFIKETPDIAMRMLEIFSNRLRKLTNIIEEISLKNVSARLAKYLVELSVKKNSNSFELDEKKRDLALKIGTVSETLSRTLKRFKEEGIIEIKGRRIRILKIELLKELSAGFKTI